MSNLSVSDCGVVDGAQEYLVAATDLAWIPGRGENRVIREIRWKVRVATEKAVLTIVWDSLVGERNSRVGEYDSFEEALDILECAFGEEV